MSEWYSELNFNNPCFSYNEETEDLQVEPDIFEDYEAEEEEVPEEHVRQEGGGPESESCGPGTWDQKTSLNANEDPSRARVPGAEPRHTPHRRGGGPTVVEGRSPTPVRPPGAPGQAFP